MDDVSRSAIELRSRAVSLTVLELQASPGLLLPAYLLADMLSPALWDLREQRSGRDASGRLRSANCRLSELQRYFHHITFTCERDAPGGDPWGLMHFPEEEERLGAELVQRVRRGYDRTLRYLLERDPQSQFGRIVEQPYYAAGCFSRLRNETLELMNAYRRISADGRASGKCAALAMLWAAVLVVAGRFSLDDIAILGNRAHIFVLLAADGGHLFNNARWFNRTRICNGSDLSRYVTDVTTGADATFCYLPSVGMCDLERCTTSIPPARVAEVLAGVGGLVGRPLRHVPLANLRAVDEQATIPAPTPEEGLADYRRRVLALAARSAGTVLDLAQYAYRSIDVAHPQAYACAALRDCHAWRRASGITGLEEALDVVRGVNGGAPLFGDRGRIALPDELLVFGTGSDRDRALLLYALLRHAGLSGSEPLIGFAAQVSYVRCGET